MSDDPAIRVGYRDPNRTHACSRCGGTEWTRATVSHSACVIGCFVRGVLTKRYAPGLSEEGENGTL